jgi:tetratricopeptide (TPR) repeat protein
MRLASVFALAILARARAEDGDERVILATIPITQSSGGEEGYKTTTDFLVYEGQTAAEAAVETVMREGWSADSVFQMHDIGVKHLAAKEGATPTEAVVAADVMALGRTLLKKGDFLAAGAAFAQLGQEAPEIKEEAQIALRSVFSSVQHLKEAETAFEKKEWSAAAEHIREIDVHVPPKGVSAPALRLMAVQCAFELGRWSSVLTESEKALYHFSHRKSWTPEQPRTKVVHLGVRAALEQGKLYMAAKLYGVVLKTQNDPDNTAIQKERKKLTALKKTMKKIRKLLSLSKNHDAIEQLGQADLLVASMGITSKILLSDIQHERCRALAGQNKFIDALLACDERMAWLNEKVVGVSVDPTKMIASYEFRAEVHTKDHNYEEAIDDIRSAMQLGEKIFDQEQNRKYQHMLRVAQHSKDEWADVEKRDCLASLDLPHNLGQVSNKEKKCKKLKGQHKKLTRLYHPDKAKGDKKRAERKFREVAESYKRLKTLWKC